MTLEKRLPKNHPIIISPSTPYVIKQIQRYGHIEEKQQQHDIDMVRSKIDHDKFEDKLITIPWIQLSSLNIDELDDKYLDFDVKSKVSKFLQKYPLQPIFCCSRFGFSFDFIHDGNDEMNDKDIIKIIRIAGEHEDYYDPDFFVYNDIFVIKPCGHKKYFDVEFIEKIREISAENGRFRGSYFDDYNEGNILLNEKYTKNNVEIIHYGYCMNIFPSTDNHQTIVDKKRNCIC